MDTIDVTAAPTSITANGVTTSTITVQLKDANGNNLTSGGDTVGLATTLGSLGSVTDNLDGTYTATLTSATTTGTATVTGTVNAAAITDNAVVNFIPGPADATTSLITAAPTSIVADGVTTSTITVQLKDANGNNLTSGGDTVALATTLGSLGSVTDNLDGTYTATLTSATTTGTATVTGTVNAAAITDNATVNFTAAPWPDCTYLYRMRLTVTTGSAAVDAGYSASITFDHAALVAAAPAKSLANGDDVRIYHWNGVGWSELDRALDPLSSWNNANAKIWFSLVDPIGASSSDANYYLVYGDSTPSAPPDDWANVFMVGDDFDDGTLTAGLDTSLNGVAAITVTGGEAVLSGGAADADAGILVTNSSLPSDEQFVIRHKFNHVSGGTVTCCNPEVKVIGIVESATEPTVTTSATENPRRRIVIFHRANNNETWIQYWDTGGNPVYWTGAAWLAGNGDWTNTLILGTYYIYDLISDGTNWHIEVRDEFGTLLTQTAPVPWASVLDNVGEDYWFYWGDVYTNAYWHDAKSDWVYLRDYVSPEPTSALGAEETNQAYCPTVPDPATSTITAVPIAITADGSSTSTITVQLVDGFGNNVTTGGDLVTVATNLGSLSGTVIDNLDGTYTETLTSAAAPGTATVTGTVNAVAITDNAIVSFVSGQPDPGASLITATPISIPNDGTTTSTITVQLRDFSLTNLTLGGDSVALFTDLGTLSVVTDNSDGTYTATLTSPTTGTATITGTVNGYYLVDTATVDVTAVGWVQCDYQFRKKITIQASQVMADQTGFPVLISLPSDSDLAASARNDGYDISFTASDGLAKLSHQIERFDGTTGELAAWVKVPNVSSSINTDIYVYYGNPTATNQEDPDGVWDANYLGVWHLDETGSGALFEYRDSTANANHGTGGKDFGAYVPVQAGGQIGYGQTFDGVNDFIDTGSSGWFDSNWTRRRRIIVDSSKVSGSSALQYFPVLIDSTVPDWRHTSNGGNVGKLDGTDIFFTDDEGGKLDHEIEYYDPVTGHLVAWVEAWIWNTQDTTLYMYYGNAVAADQQDVPGTWDEGGANNFKSVWHLNEEAVGTGTVDVYQDSTSNLNHGDDLVSATGQNGQIDGGQELDGSDDFVDMGDVLDFADPANFTLESWIRPTIPAGGLSDQMTFMSKWGGAGDRSYRFEVETDGTLTLLLVPSVNIGGTTVMNSDTWYHAAVTVDQSSNEVRLYLDGTEEDSNLSYAGALVNTTASFNLGRREQPSQWFDGDLDEARISNIVRSADWIATEFNNQSDPYSFYRILREELPADVELDLTGTQITLEAWVNVDTGAPADIGAMTKNGWADGYRMTASSSRLVNFQLGEDGNYPFSATALLSETWYQVVATYDGTDMQIYIDGSPDGASLTKIAPNLESAGKEFWIGHGDHAIEKAWSFPWDGELDEVRVSDVARNADWVATQHNNQSSPATFYIVGSEELNGAFCGPAAATSTITAAPTSIAADGTSTSTITVQLKDSFGNNMTSGGDSVAVATDLGTLSGTVIDNGDGTYSETLTSSVTVGTATITGTVNAVAIADNATVDFTSTGGPWWSCAYQYRDPVTITAGSSAVPAGYAVSITFDHAALVTAGKSLANGDDLRVVYWNGASWIELDRFLDPGSSWDSATTEVWFKTQVAIGASSSDTDHFLYYGNPVAGAPPADPNNIFAFYDGFESGDVTAWDTTFTQPGDTISTTTTPVHSGTDAGRADVDATDPGQATVRDDFASIQGFASTMWVYFPAGYNFNQDTSVNQFFGGVWGEQQLSLIVRAPTQDVFIWNNVAGQGYFGSPATVINTGQWYRLEMKSLISPTVGRAELWVDGVREVNESNRNTGIVNTDNNLVGIYWKPSGPNTLYFDDVFNRLWVDPEPTTALNGEEDNSAYCSGGTATLHRSVGTSSGDLNVSGRTVAISGTTATFSGAMPDNIGVGDVLTYNSGGNQLAFITARTSSTVYTVADKDGGTPASAPALTAVGVYRAYTSLFNWESSTENANITEPVENDVNPSTDLVSADSIMMVAAYGDGPDTTNLDINSWTTGSNNYIKIYTPTGTSEVGITQRHSGVWDTSKYYIEAVEKVIDVWEEYVRIEGLQIRQTSVVQPGDSGIIVNATGTAEYQFSHNIIRGVTSTNWHTGIEIYTVGPSSVAYIWNNVIYDFGDSTFGYAMNPTDPDLTSYIYNNTMYNNGNGILEDEGAVAIAKNNIAFGHTGNDYGGMDAASDNNLGEDAAIPGDANYVQTSQTAAQMFVDPSGSPRDLHILSTSDAYNAGADLSGDGNLPFADDIDLDTRSGSWDIGADEDYVPPLTAIYYSVGIDSSPLYSANASAASGTLTLASAAANNIGVGDEVREGANRYYITGRSSSTVFAIQNSAASGTPGDTNITFGSTAITIYRAFNSLSAAVTGAGDSSHLNNFDLAAGNFQLNWIGYNDGALDETVLIDGYTTGASNYIHIYSPTSTSEVGASQRHDGTAGTGFRMAPVNSSPSNPFLFFEIRDDFVRVTGLEIDGTGITNARAIDGIEIDASVAASGDIRLDSLIIHDIRSQDGGGTDADVRGIVLNSGNLKLSNSILYDLAETTILDNADVKVILIKAGTSSYLHNNTIFTIKNTGGAGDATGIYQSAGTVTAKNNVVLDVVSASSLDDCFLGTITQSSNVSSDSTAVGVQNRTGPYGNYFADITNGSEDLHLLDDSNALWTSYGVDLDGDPNLPITNDIDGDARDANQPDIGADEFTGAAGPAWWDSNYANRAQITVSAGSSAISADYPTRFEFDHASLVTATKSLAGGDDARIVYWNGATNTEIDRIVFDDGIVSSSWNSATSTLMFKTTATIAASGSDTGYYLYYGYPSALTPPNNTPSSRYYRAEQLTEFTSIDTTNYASTGASLTFTPSTTSEQWVVVATWRQRDTRTAGSTEVLGEARVRVNTVVRTGTDDIAYKQSGDSYTSSGTMFKITGTTSPQTIDVQFRAVGGSFNDGIDDIRILAFMIPDPANANIQYSESLATVNDISATPVDALQISFSPSSAGNYIWMGNGFHHENPGGASTEGLHLDDETDTTQQESDETYGNQAPSPMNGYVNLMHFEERNLTTGAKTFTFRHLPDPTGSERRGLSMLLFRSDVFEGVETVDDATRTTTTSTSPQTKVSLTTATQASERDYIYLAVMMQDDAGASSVLNPSFADIRHAGNPMMTSTMAIDRGPYDTTLSWASAEYTAGNQTIEERFWSSGATVTARAEYAHILALRYKEPGTTLGPEE